MTCNQYGDTEKTPIDAIETTYAADKQDVAYTQNTSEVVDSGENG